MTDAPATETKASKKVKPCRICTSLHKEGKEVPHDPSRLHTDTNSTDPKLAKRGAR